MSPITKPNTIQPTANKVVPIISKTSLNTGGFTKLSFAYNRPISEKKPIFKKGTINPKNIMSIRYPNLVKNMIRLTKQNKKK